MGTRTPFRGCSGYRRGRSHLFFGPTASASNALGDSPPEMGPASPCAKPTARFRRSASRSATPRPRFSSVPLPTLSHEAVAEIMSQSISDERPLSTQSSHSCAGGNVLAPVRSAAWQRIEFKSNIPAAGKLWKKPEVDKRPVKKRFRGLQINVIAYSTPASNCSF